MPKTREPRLDLQFNVPTWVSFQYDEPKVVPGENGDSFMFGSVMPDGGQKSVWFAPNGEVANLIKDALGQCRLNNLPRRLALMKFQIGSSRRHFFAIGLPAGAGILAAPKTHQGDFGQEVATVIPEHFYEFYRRQEPTAQPASTPQAQLLQHFDEGVAQLQAAKDARTEQLTAMVSEIGNILSGVQSQWEALVERKYWDMVIARRISEGKSGDMGDMTEGEANDYRKTLAVEMFVATRDAYREMSGNVATLFIQRAMSGRWK